MAVPSVMPGGLQGLLNTIGDYGRMGMDYLTGVEPIPWGSLPTPYVPGPGPQYGAQPLPQTTPPAPVPMGPPAPQMNSFGIPSGGDEVMSRLPTLPPAPDPMAFPPPPDPYFTAETQPLPGTLPPGHVDGGVDHSMMGNWRRGYDTDTAQMMDAMKEAKADQFWASIAQGYGSNPFSVVGGKADSAPGIAQSNSEVDILALKAQRERERLAQMGSIKDLLTPPRQPQMSLEKQYISSLPPQEQRAYVERKFNPKPGIHSVGGQQYPTRGEGDGKEYYHESHGWVDVGTHNSLLRSQDVLDEASDRKAKATVSKASSMEAMRKMFPGRSDSTLERLMAFGVTAQGGSGSPEELAQMYAEAKIGVKDWLIRYGDDETRQWLANDDPTEDEMVEARIRLEKGTQ